ncbi:hypothetical protein Pcinc_027441 [Petrolisthes cinctipes]|uniref:BZIP domain-containing protein n=1 Tax=Petrolisthes cinctipes TaxID=88211 RepID=A0AAE1F571_PETCI|nr:hypothetical protein Pcinc_027441 [Petrolisthes cinctipes]
MYLNVNLTPPPPGAGEASCTTPKTPEILNSLINLTSPPLPNSYSQYQNQVEGGVLLSPTSDLSSPGEEVVTNSLTTCDLTPVHVTHPMSVACGFPSGMGGGGGLVGGSPGTSGIGGPLAGVSPPSTPDLPSPVNTLEATKTALIKEGLKLQIRCKLQAAGVGTPESILEDTKFIKDEDCCLTEEDEERRRRRRERNKIAATKCRNKKKEKTIVLMSESETVEDINYKLKTEIQRLQSEKNNLEKLLGDPNHRASCRHTPRCPKAPRPPLVIVTPADSPDTTTSSSPSSSSSSSSTCSESPTSPPHNSTINYNSPTTSISQVLPQSQVSSALNSPPSSTSSPNPTSCGSSSSQFLAPKYCHLQSVSQRHHPYQFPGRSQQSTGTEDQKLHYTNSPPSTGAQTKNSYNYVCLGVPRTNEFVSPSPPNQKSVYNAPKSRSSGLTRYSPYGGRTPPVTSPLVTHTHPQSATQSCGENYIQANNNNGCGREDQQSYVTDVHANQFFPPCSYTSM